MKLDAKALATEILDERDKSYDTPETVRRMVRRSLHNRAPSDAGRTTDQIIDLSDLFFRFKDEEVELQPAEAKTIIARMGEQIGPGVVGQVRRVFDAAEKAAQNPAKTAPAPNGADKPAAPAPAAS